MATPGMRALVELQQKLVKIDPKQTDLIQTEEEIRAALDAVGVELMASVLQAADIDTQEILVNGVLHGRIDHREAKVHTTFGLAVVQQTLYGRERGHGWRSSADIF